MDGKTEVVIGAKTGIGPGAGGAVFVCQFTWGPNEATLSLITKIPNPRPGSADDHFGAAVAPAGDLNNDSEFYEHCVCMYVCMYVC